MLKILIAGKNGQVGWELQRSLATLGKIIVPEKKDFDLTNPDSIRKQIQEAQPEIIINAAAYTAVDKAESEPDIAMTINGKAPGILAEEAKKLNALLVHYSTDYVFDGLSRTPYTEKDLPNPLSSYGKSKLEGEKAIQAIDGRSLILRTSWVYSTRGTNFLLTMLRLAKENKKELKIVDDQIGAPTWSRTIAEATAQILTILQCSKKESEQNTEIYHLTAQGQTSWYHFAKAIFEFIQQQPAPPPFSIPKVINIPSSEYPQKAIRPPFSVLSNQKLYNAFGLQPSDWKDWLSLSLNDLCLVSKWN